MNYKYFTPASEITLSRPLDLDPLFEACSTLALHIQSFGLFDTKGLVSKVSSARFTALTPFHKAMKDAEADLLASGYKVGVAGISKAAITLRSNRYAEAKAKYEEACREYRLACKVVDYQTASWPLASVALAR
jgi:hypothetical protein